MSLPFGYQPSTVESDPLALLGRGVEVDSATVAARLSTRYGIGVRDGLFCAHPLTRHLLDGPRGTALRASLGLGTRTAEGRPAGGRPHRTVTGSSQPVGTSLYRLLAMSATRTNGGIEITRSGC
jgi:hypothetical protein